MQKMTSSATIHLTGSGNDAEVQIFIDDEQLFNRLPGKHERGGVKNLAAWPIFVTAIRNDILASRNAEYSAERHQVERMLREDDAIQFPIFDLATTVGPRGTKARRRQVDKTLSEIRRLHEDLNAQLYARPTERPKIQSPADAFQILQPFLGPLEHEELWVMNLDTRNRVMSLVKLYQGSVNQSQVRVGEIFRQAISDNSPLLIIAHNHPSGDPSPSPDDIAVTRAIVQAGSLLDIEVLDHMVIANTRYVSLKERGLGFGG